MRAAGGDELRGLSFRRRVTQEGTSANFRAGEVLEQVGPAQRRVEFDVEVKPCGVALSAVPDGAPSHKERHLPEIVETDGHVAEHCRGIASFVVCCARCIRKIAGRIERGISASDHYLSRPGPELPVSPR
jgi:hypothetical protein